MNDIAKLRRWVFALVIATAVALACGRIASTQLLYEPSLHRNESDPGNLRIWPKARPRPMPTYSSNDRSRWATVRALADDGTYAIGRRDPAAVLASAVAPLGTVEPWSALGLAEAGFYVRTQKSDAGIVFEDGWQSIDKVLHPGSLKFYSSKPPLLSTLVAGLYWLLQALHDELLGLLYDVMPGCFESMPERGAWTLERQPFEVVRTILFLINVVPFTVYLVLLSRLVQAWGRSDEGRLYVLFVGAFATLVTPFLIAFNNHTIGTFCVMAAWFSLLRIARSVADPRAFSSGWYDFASAGFFAAFAACNEMPALAFAAAVFVLLLWYRPLPALLVFLPAAALPALAFFATNHAAVGQWRPAYSEFGSPWYEYEGSYWRKTAEGPVRRGIDWASYRESRLQYAFHVLLGHHGLFSLAPVWLLALAAMVAGSVRLGLWRSALHSADAPPDGLPWFVQPLGLGLTVVVIGFYLVKSDNYGGWTNGPRWLMWLTPIWLTCLLPAADRLSRSRMGRVVALAALAVSVFSVHYDLWNPWRHPWLYDFMQEMGWPGY